MLGYSITVLGWTTCVCMMSVIILMHFTHCAHKPGVYKMLFILGVGMDIILISARPGGSDCSEDGCVVHETISKETR